MIQKNWNIVHTVMKNRKLTYHQLTGIKDQFGTELANSTELANALNRHFCTVGKKVRATLSIYKSPQRPANSTPTSIYLEATSSHEVETIIASTDQIKS